MAIIDDARQWWRRRDGGGEAPDATATRARFCLDMTSHSSTDPTFNITSQIGVLLTLKCPRHLSLGLPSVGVHAVCSNLVKYLKSASAVV